MIVKKLKVRPRKNPPTNLCAPELATLLGCWAASNDYGSTEKCREVSQALYECMRNAPMKGKQHRPTINYHLARLGKNLK
ncbi:hypothetical protein GLOTRDRAFT_114879 [Gloeophyllum trabeum ATCC 11539]|uniref:CHCH domain-containing protein n=1 Tax=Gloeophyllum trabeum (strain ATCC 11539 / FP-39264 / Madison 617) TaxID=670483 RepID=S7QF33_GLOTA|nr:uncharacterized protein GLOTRDRAFT_114879 [Gloeophyllum trabeum ATCC 11539]EPQ58451.1 hypothetical protein GLOTRDRAFT_114879 [Gloeophyllum trabeum ATCC 11539]